jgi:hypothetical protein
MKTTFLQWSVVVGCASLFAACGADKAASEVLNNVPVPASTCTAVSTQDLVDAGFASKPNACSGQMFDKYKEAGFEAVNGEIGKLALSASPNELGASFQTKIAQATPERQKEFVAHLLSFLEAAYGSTTPYTGPDMVTSHKDLGITRAQYSYFISDVVVPALTTAGVDPNDITNCFAPVVTDTAFVKTVVTCK